MSDDPQTASDAGHAAAPAAERAPSTDAAGTPAPWPRWTPLALATAVPVLFFCTFLARSGLWDPYELNVADLSRRIALNLFGASGLALAGADNSLPHLNDLGRPQLPFSSIALGFKIFGLHEWAGRLPLALWGVAGVLATYAFVARFFDRRTGVYAAVVLSTTPLYFVQARSMLGDVCTMSGIAMAFGGLAVAAFDRGDSAGGVAPTAAARRLPWLAMGALGLFVGFESRGGLLGLGVPLLGVGLAWAVLRVSAVRAEDVEAPRDPFGDAVGAAALAAGLVVAAMAARAVSAEGKNLDYWIGTLARAPSKYPTFDYYVAAIGHALAPWSAFLPFAFGRLLFAPKIGKAAERESIGRIAVLVGAAVAFVAHAYLVERTDLVVFCGPALCAVACAVAIRDLERGAGASIVVGFGTLVFAALLHHDFHELPEKAYQAFGITSAPFPEGFKSTALGLWWAVLGGFALCALFTWIERDSDRAPFHPESYAKVLRSLQGAYDGALSFVYLSVVAAASIAGVLVVVGSQRHAHFLPQMSSTIRDLILNAWWALAFVPLAAIFGLLFACDVWLWAFGRCGPLSSASITRGFAPFEELFARLRPAEGGAGAPPRDRYQWWVALLVVAPLMLLVVPAIVWLGLHEANVAPLLAASVAVPSGVVFFLVMGFVGDLLRHRAPGLALGGAVVGSVLCFAYYPALANQLSPKEIFESYRAICPGAPLGLLGVGGRTAAYYAGGQPQTLSDPQSAYKWLVSGGERRCLALKADELPQLNKLWREASGEPRTNLPILDARSSQILLASSALRAGEKNHSPIGSMVLSSPPNPQHKLDVDMDDKLQVLGYDLVDDRGRPIDAVSPGTSSRIRTYYRVLAPLMTEWEAFIHIDGYKRRHNGDHKPLDGKYPMSLWLPGDLLVDDYEFKLEPNFTPGTYQIYFGLFVGDTRLKIKSGPNDGDNRINGGPLRVQ